MNETSKTAAVLMSEPELEALKLRSKTRVLITSELEALFNHIAALESAVVDGYGLINVIASSNSQFASRARDVVNKTLFGTTDKAVIEAAKRYLAVSGALKSIGVRYIK